MISYMQLTITWRNRTHTKSVDCDYYFQVQANRIWFMCSVVEKNQNTPSDSEKYYNTIEDTIKSICFLNTSDAHDISNCITTEEMVIQVTRPNKPFARATFSVGSRLQDVIDWAEEQLE